MDPKDELRHRLGAEEAVLFALLFGSRASGTERPDSDWDVAVYLDDRLTARERFDMRLRLTADLATIGRVDVVVLNDAPPLLGHRALSGERLLIQDRSAFVRYFVRTLALAEDDRFYRELHRRRRAERLEEGRFGRP